MKFKLLTAGLAALALTSCTADPYTGQPKLSNTAGGALIGAGGGALGGALIASATGGNAGTGALIGAGVGAIAGGGIGAYMDQQEAELRGQLQGTGVSVTRVGDQIILNLPSNITFDVDKSNVKPEFIPTLRSVALVLQKFDRTLVEVYGHTDNTGSESYNLQLSRERAISVANTISAQGVDPRRFYAYGRGESEPIASNATEAGRAQNRRVEVRIAPPAQG